MLENKYFKNGDISGFPMSGFILKFVEKYKNKFVRKQIFQKWRHQRVPNVRLDGQRVQPIWESPLGTKDPARSRHKSKIDGINHIKKPKRKTNDKYEMMILFMIFLRLIMILSV